MRKLLTLALKEVRLTFRDVAAIVTMLVTPLALTLAIAAAFSGGGGGNLSDIPVLLLNQDRGTFSQPLIDGLQSKGARALIDLHIVTDEAAARARVDADESAVLIIIPPDFSARVFPQGAAVQNALGLDLTTLDQAQTEALTPEQQQIIGMIFAQAQIQATPSAPTVIELYASPNWRISTAVVKGIVTQSIEIMNIEMHGIQNIMTRITLARIQQGAAPEDSASMTGALPGGLGDTGDIGDLPVRLQTVSPSGRGFNWLDYSAASMAILFLMFAVTSGGRTLLAEQEWGTLPRLLVSPTPALAILVGKMAGVVLTGLLQVIILWGATALVGAYWGPPLAVIPAILALVICVGGVGAMVSAWAQTPGQAGAIGSAITLIGAAVSGSFFPRMNLPVWVQKLSLITPQAWGIEIFSKLQQGGRLADILPLLGAVLLVTVFYYGVALVGFRRQFK